MKYHSKSHIESNIFNMEQRFSCVCMCVSVQSKSHLLGGVLLQFGEVERNKVNGQHLDAQHTPPQKPSSCVTLCCVAAQCNCNHNEIM